MSKLALSAPTREKLETMAQQYYYSPNVRISEKLEISNSKGIIQGCKVILKKGRYRLEHI